MFPRKGEHILNMSKRPAIINRKLTWCHGFSLYSYTLGLSRFLLGTANYRRRLRSCNQKELGGIWLWGQVFSLASAKCALEYYGVECEVDEIFSHET